MFFNESRIEDILHIPYKEIYIVYFVSFCIGLSIGNSLGNSFYAYYLFSFFGYELGNGPRTGVKVINQFISGKSGEIPGYFI